MSLYQRNWPGDPARPALALHCMMGSGAGWGPIADRLEGRVDLTAPDLPGHGRSPAWDAAPHESFGDGADRAAQGLAAALAARAAEGRLDLIGHSFGAVAALRLAVAASDRIRSLTLIEPVMFGALPVEARDPDGLLPRLDQLERAGDHMGAAAAFLRYWNGPDPAMLSPAARDQLGPQMRAVLDTMPDLYDDRAGILRPGGLESIAAPIMLISGARSPAVIHDIAAALAARFQDVGRATVPDAGHMAPLTHPDQVAGLIAVNLNRA